MGGVRRYIKEHAYSTTTTDDLWNALSKVSGKDVKEFASIWTKKVEHLIVSVSGLRAWTSPREAESLPYHWRRLARRR